MAADETLFLAGDYEAQKMCGSGAPLGPFLTRHFLYSVLISASVNMPAGCYYQSEYTRSLVRRYGALYRPSGAHEASAELSIGDDRASFADDVNIKKSWFPEKYGYTDEETTACLTKSLSGIQPRIRSGSMRRKLAASISADLAEGSRTREVLGQVLPAGDQGAEFLQPLKRVIEVQEYAMLPTYIEIEMDRHGQSSQYGRRRWLEFILFKGYSQSCEEAYQCYCNNPLRIFYDPDFRRIHPYRLDYRDTNLFYAFVQIFPFRGLKHVERLGPGQVLKIKYSREFQFYLRLYRMLVSLLEEELQAVLWEGRPNYMSAQNAFQDFAYRELKTCRQALLQNTQEAMILYRTLKNPFLRSRRFQAWAAKGTEFPSLQILSCVKDERHGICRSYLRELFQASREVERQAGRRKKGSQVNLSLIVGENNRVLQKNQEQEEAMNNYAITIGKDNRTEQKNEIHVTAQTPAGAEAPLTLEDFRKIPAGDLEKFKRAVSESRDIDEACCRAVLEVLNAGYSRDPQSFEAYLDAWKKSRRTFSEKAANALSALAGAANIGSFVVQLLSMG